ncbi:SAM-dependent methyltransferase [Actinomadura madurae]|uniref:SAM-dependent methyltransferase n=1 Tax=Actinomadura madurae TaxID=1993 RepID=UPI00399A6029
MGDAMTGPRDAEPVPGVDTGTPSAARMYDYFLGGKDNYASDRTAGAGRHRRAHRHRPGRRA